MGRTAPRTGYMLAELRRYFGLPQWEVAGLLRVSVDYYRLLELEQRPLNARHLVRILPLLQAVPAAAAAADAAPLPPPPPPAFAFSAAPAAHLQAVEARFDYCRHTAWKLRRAAHAYAVQAHVAARWAEALPLLRTTEPFASEPGVAEWLAVREEALSPADQTKQHLLLARATGLEAEAAALLTLLQG